MPKRRAADRGGDEPLPGRNERLVLHVLGERDEDEDHDGAGGRRGTREAIWEGPRGGCGRGSRPVRMVRGGMEGRM